MRNLVLLVLCCSNLMLAAQTWQWSQQIGGPGDETAVIAGVDAAGAVYVHGHYDNHWNSETYGLYIGQDTLQEANHSTYLAKFSADGTLQWLRSCTSVVGIGINNAVLDTVDQRLYVVGVYGTSCTLDTLHLEAPGPYGAAFLSQWDLDGRCIWARNVALSGADQFGNSCGVEAVALDGQGRILVGGHTAPVNPNLLGGKPIPQGTFTAAYTTAGDTLWTRMVATYDGTTRMLDPLEMHTWGGHAFVYNALYLANTTDTLLIADSVVTGYSGGGYALFRMNTEDGALDWFITDDWHQGPVPTQFPHQFALGDDGDAFVTGSYGTAVFSSDTLNAPGQSIGGFIAKYDTSGTLLWARGYEASSGSLSFTAICGSPGGGLSVVSSMVGTVNWDGITETSGPRELLVASFSGSGQCLGVETDIGPSEGVSVCASTDALYLTGAGLTPYESDNVVWPR